MPQNAEKPQALPTLAVLGAGALGSSILDGLAASGVEVTGGIRVTTRRESARARSAAVTVSAVDTDPDANRRAVAGAGLVLVGVKPHLAAALLAEIGPVLEPGAVVVSLAVGVTIEQLQQQLPDTVAVVRAMPNTPTGVRRGVTGLARGTNVSDAQLELARRVFGQLGEVVVVPEEKMDALAALAGSGPAYVYLLIEEWTRAAQQLGFDRDDALQLVSATVGGAVTLLHESGSTPQELRRAVTSPGGTTERAIAVLQSGELEALFASAMRAALERAAEIAAERR